MGGADIAKNRDVEPHDAPISLIIPQTTGDQTAINIFGVIAPQNEADKDARKKPHKVKERHHQSQT